MPLLGESFSLIPRIANTALTVPLTNSHLHATIARHFVAHGTAPTIRQLGEHLALPVSEVAASLRALADYHGVVLHPGSGEIWAMHPFSAAPTNFWVEGATGRWWGNCAWCALGVAALVREDVTITTTLGAESRQAVLRIEGGVLQTPGYVVHFPVPMAHAWDNVTYTCSVMLLFESAAAVDAWCARHAMPRGDVQPVARIWEFAQAWYGRHLDDDWVKWTSDEARTLFERFGLTGPTWALPGGGERF